MKSGAPPLDRSTPPVGSPVRAFRLPPVSSAAMESGLRLRSLFRARVPLVGLVLVLDAGEARVPAGSGGLAVLSGNALQGGTARRSGAELAEQLERLGTGLGVRTGWDATLVSVSCLAEHLDRVMALAGEVVRTPSFPGEEVERARLRQLAAIRQRRMSPGRLADDELASRLFPAGHPYRRPLSGDEGSVAVLDRDALVGFAAARYGPRGAGLAVAGELSPDRVRDLAARYLGDWRETGPDEAPAVSPLAPVPGRRVVIVDRPGSVQSEIRIGHVALPRGHPDELALRFANTILGGAFTSRLNLSLREKHGFTYGARSRLHLHRDGGVLIVGAAVETRVTAPALGEAVAVLGRFREEGPSAGEVTRARDYLAGILPLRMETTSQVAGRLAELIIFGLPDDYHHTERERIGAVGVEVATAAARAYIRAEHSAIVVVGDGERIGSEVEGLGLGPVEVVVR